MKQSGFTLVELVVVILIIAILAALAFPVFTSAKDKAKQSICVSNLRQLAQAVAMYRADAGGDGVAGDMYAMGLPPQPLTVSLEGTRPLWHCDGRGRSPKLSAIGFPYRYVPAPPGYKTGDVFWADYVAQEGDLSILLMDLNHNAPTVSMVSPFTTKFGIGVHLDTSVVERRRRGDPWADGFVWWK